MDVEQLKTTPERFLNRELSWLAFNKRVLEEANNPDIPLFERVRFLSICSSNLDEFYMVRVAGLMGQITAGVSGLSPDGKTPQQQLSAIHETAHPLIENMQTTWDALEGELADNGIRIVGYKKLTKADRAFLAKKFEDEIKPVLTPIALDPAHPFPFIPNKGLSIAMQLYDHETNAPLNVLMQIPSILERERFIRLPGKKTRYVPMEKVIIRNLQQIFSEHMELRNYALFRVIRDGEMEIDDEAEDLVRTFETALKRRRRGHVVTMSVHKNVKSDMLNFLMRQLEITPEQVISVDGMVALGDCAQLIDSEKQNLLFKPFNARYPERIREHKGDCFAAIRAKDIIVHHPYESFDVVVEFLNQAARDPDVISIKQTLYRTSDNSPIVEALIEAAENGKSVIALVELKARFDEEANIRWARNLERAGVQVVYGFIDLKTHAKVSLVVRREGKAIASYAHFGTGNYHAINAKIYTDLSFFTCEKKLCADAGALFNYMSGYAKPQNLEKLAIAPLNLREQITRHIEREIAFARAGKPAYIWMKCNSLMDTKIIDKLYEASQAGVHIELVVRGICTLRPGIPGLSENIHVKSIVGRYLEHSRIYCFGNGHALPSMRAKVYISSADLMERNLNRRIETLVPIENKTVHRQVLSQIMVANLKDTRQSWVMLEDGRYERVTPDSDAFSAHDYFMNNPSLSGRGKTLVDAPMPPRLRLSRLVRIHNSKAPVKK